MVGSPQSSSPSKSAGRRTSYGWLSSILNLLRKSVGHRTWVKREQLERFRGLLPESQGYNLAVTILSRQHLYGMARCPAKVGSHQFQISLEKVRGAGPG